jgi:hypothetical protein
LRAPATFTAQGDRPPGFDDASSLASTEGSRWPILAASLVADHRSSQLTEWFRGA